MEQIIQAISKNLNLPETTVKMGLGVILNFAKQQATGTQFEKLVAILPGAEDLMKEAPTGESGAAGGLLGGLLGKAGDLLGGNLGAAAGALAALEKAGVPMDKAAPLARQFFEQAQTVAGPDVVNSVLDQVPALKTFLAKSA